MAEPPERTRYCSRCLTTFASDPPRCPNLACRAARPAVGWGELLEAGEIIDRTYRIHERLAIGGAGVTYLGGELAADGSAEVGPRVAIKVLYQQRDQGPYLRRLSTEAQILQGLNHPQIVECRGFVHRAGHSPYLVTRYEEGGSLLDHIRRVGTLSIPVVAGIGRQVSWALEVAHRQGVVHRDLKPENVLLERDVPAGVIPTVRVADFGIAKVYGGVGDRLTRVGAFVGTPQYAAPEQFDGLAPEPATDVYAVGALLYFCLAARPVADFMAELDPESQRDHLVRHLPPRLDASVGPPELRRWMEDTLAVAMAVDPGDRCDLTQLDARLAAIQEGRDPGFVRLPPAGTAAARTAEGASPALSADTLDTGYIRPLATADVSGTHVAPLPALPPPVGPSPVAPPPDPAPTRPAPEPAPTAARMEPAKDARSARNRPSTGTAAAPLGCGLALAGGAGLALVAALLVGWFYLRAAPTVLTGTEADPEVARDWRLVAGALGERGVAAEQVCNTRNLQVEVVVEGNGALRSLRFRNYDHEPTRRCMEAELRKAAFPRAGTGAVQVAVSLPR